MGETVNSVSSLGFRLNTLTCSCVNVQRCGGLSRPRRSGTLPSPPHGCMCATILSPHPTHPTDLLTIRLADARRLSEEWRLDAPCAAVPRRA